MTSTRGNANWWDNYVTERVEDDDTTAFDLLAADGTVIATLTEPQYDTYHEDFVSQENGGVANTSAVFDELITYLILRSMIEDRNTPDPFDAQFMEAL